MRATLSICDGCEAITGNGVDSYYGFTKMLWLRNHRPDVWSKTRYFLPPNAFVIHALTGEIAVDRSSAGNIGGVYDIDAGTWSGEMLDALGIPRAMMPRAAGRVERRRRRADRRAPRDGSVSPPGTPVVAGGVDAAVATLAAGVTRAGQHVAMIGSSMCWGYISPGRRRAPRPGQHAARVRRRARRVRVRRRDHRRRGGHVVSRQVLPRLDRPRRSDAASTSMTCSKPARATVARGRRRRAVPAVPDGRAQPDLGRQGERRIRRPEPLSPPRAPVSRGARRASASRCATTSRPGANGAAALDERLIVVGGAAHSDLWMQIIADVTGRPVFTIEQEVEARDGRCAARRLRRRPRRPTTTCGAAGSRSRRARAAASTASVRYDALFDDVQGALSRAQSTRCTTCTIKPRPTGAVPHADCSAIAEPQHSKSEPSRSIAMNVMRRVFVVATASSPFVAAASGRRLRPSSGGARQRTHDQHRLLPGRVAGADHAIAAAARSRRATRSTGCRSRRACPAPRARSPPASST